MNGLLSNIKRSDYLSEIRAPIQGEFINLRLLCIDDAELTFSWRESARASLLNRGSANVAEQVNWIKSRPDSELNFIIENKKNIAIGMISLINIDHKKKRSRIITIFNRQ